MRNLFKTKTFLFLFGMLFFMSQSCTEKEIADTLITEVPPGFNYAKSFDINDSEGNMVTVQIAANDRSLIEFYKPEDFEFNISKEDIDYSKSVELNLTEGETRLVENENSNVIFVNVINHHFNDDVKRFNVVPKNMFDEIDSRTVTTFQFGANGVNGASVFYDSEDRSSCYLDIDLGRKDFKHTWWRELMDATLADPGEYTFYCSGTFYDEYRLKVNSQGWRCANDNKVRFRSFWEMCP